MAVYSVNQATHLYVVAGDATLSGTTTDLRYCTKMGAKSDLTSDKIDINKIIKVTKTTSQKLTPVIKVTSFDVTAATAGTYVMRVLVKNAFSDSPSGMYIKHAVAYAGADASAYGIATELAKSLQKGLKRDLEPAFKVMQSGPNIKLYPLVTEWIKGKKAAVVPEIAVEFVPTDEYATEATWVDNVTTSTFSGTMNTYPGLETRNLGAEKLADYEYFCLGERGDLYRGVGYPHNIETKGQIDETKDYHIITVHYYDSLSNESVQKSEKTAVFCTEDAETAQNIYNNFTAPTGSEGE